MLLVFAGGGKEGSLIDKLQQAAVNVTAVDIALGGPSHNVLMPSVSAALKSSVRSGHYDFIMLAPPCSTFSAAKDPPLRSRQHLLGLPDLSPDARALVERHNDIVTFTVTLALLAHARGIHYAVEQPADRGDDKSDAYWPDMADCANMYLTPQMRLLHDATQPSARTFPQCALGSPAQKYTTIWTTSPSLANNFEGLVCTHVGRHAEVAHGITDDGHYRSADAAAYPPEMNDLITAAILADAARAPPAQPPATTRPPVASTTKVDGLHPIAAAPPLTASQHTAVRLYKRD